MELPFRKLLPPLQLPLLFDPSASAVGFAPVVGAAQSKFPLALPPELVKTKLQAEDIKVFFLDNAQYADLTLMLDAICSL
jgi:hypothetical protein